jgi:hypothetical protein
MTHEDEQCLKFGRMVLGMIRDLGQAAASEIGYCRRHVTFRGGSVELFVVNSAELAEAFDAAAARRYSVKNVTPKSETN